MTTSRSSGCTASPLEGTYLPWLDCRRTGLASDELAGRLLRRQRLMVNPGTMYGPGGEGFLRLNMACPRALWQEGLERLANGLDAAPASPKEVR